MLGKQSRTSAESQCDTASEIQNFTQTNVNNDVENEPTTSDGASTASVEEMEVEPAICQMAEITNMFSGNKVFVLLTGKTLNVHKIFLEHLKQQKPDLEEVENVCDCDYVMVFCPIVSRAGTDIEAALKKLHVTAGTKPALFVVLHHTFDPDCVVPDSNRAVKRQNSFTVDCLFYEDQGLLQCPKNAESLGKIMGIIKPEESWGIGCGLKGFTIPNLWSWLPSIYGSKDQSQVGKATEKNQVPETDENDSVLRILVSWGNESGKISAKNLILGREEMNQAATSSAEFIAIRKSESIEEEVAGRKVTVVETPDLFSADLSQRNRRKYVEEAITLSKPGPHAFLLIIPVKLAEDNKINMVEELKVTFLKMEEIFGEMSWEYTTIIFSVRNESLKSKIEEFIHSNDPELQSLVKKCGYRYNFLIIKENEDGPQVPEYLLKKIEKEVGGNRKNFYSSEVYLKTLASIGGIEKKISNELEKLDDPANELMRNLEEEDNKTKRKYEQDLAEEKARSPKRGKMVEGPSKDSDMEIQKVPEVENMETEKNETKTFLLGLWRDILNSSMKMQEEIEKKDKQIKNDNKMYEGLLKHFHFPEESK